MATPASTPVADAMTRLRRGQGDLSELADALAGLDHLVAVVPPGEATRFLGELDAAVADKGIGNVGVGDADAPRIAGDQDDDDRFVPRYFSDDELAREYAVLSGLIAPDESAMMITMSPDELVRDVLSHGWGGLVLDDGADHEIRLDDESVRRLYALMTLEAFARLPVLHAVFEGESLYLQRVRGRDGVQAFVFASRDAADHAVPHLRLERPSAREIDTAVLLDTLLEHGVTLLVADPGLPGQRPYLRDDLVRMRELAAGNAAEPGAAAAPRSEDPHAALGAMATPSSAEIPEALQRALSIDRPPPVTPPGRTDDDSRQIFSALYERLQGDEPVPAWEYMDALAFDLDWYVPMHARDVDGLRWPALWKHPDNEDASAVFAFCERDLAQRALGDDVELVHLSGVEALRWLRAAPRPVDEVIFNYHRDRDGFLKVPVSWSTVALYPQAVEIASLDHVRRVGLARLGRFPGARGLQPEVVRALLQGWKQLIAADGPDGGTPVVSDAGVRYMPLFSSADAYFDFDGASPGILGGPRMEDDAPAFGDWLQETSHLDGALLDPGGRAPLSLDATALLVLDLWARDGSQPTGTEITMEVARLRAEERLPARVAGRILADWPTHWIGMDRSGEQMQILLVPDRDCCAIFTSEDRARLFIESARQAGALGPGMEPIPVHADWRGSIFCQIGDGYEDGCWIDPEPLGAGLGVYAAGFLGESDAEFDPALVMEGYAGIHVDGEMLAALVARLEEHLTPRLDGWIAGA